MGRGVYASMSTVGYVTEPILKISRAYAAWWANKKDQCLVTRDVESYIYCVNSAQGNKELLLSRVKTSLTNMFNELFDKIDALNVVAESVPPGDSFFIMKISGGVIQDGVYYDISRSIELFENTFELVKEGRLHASNIR